jgi:septal ring factor EnvC (AmiA/AmiB activator)
MKKRFLFLPLLLFSLFPPAFSQEAYLTDAEFQTLLSIIRQSKANSEAQTKLIAELRTELRAQEAELKEALNALELSEAALTDLKASLSRIRGYSKTLNEYCLTLEKENRKLRTGNKFLKIGCGAGGAFLIALILLLCL